jgi:ankyrin repeat protein
MFSNSCLSIVQILFFILVNNCIAIADDGHVTVEDLIKAQGNRASEKKLIEIYRSGLSVNSRNKHGATPLHVACWFQGYPSFVRLLVDEGADVNSVREKGWTPLLDASSSPGKTKIVKFLIEHGARLSDKRFDGQSALHLAVFMDDLQTAKLLIDEKIDVNAQDNTGRTPIYYVKNQDMAEILIQKGARINMLDKKGLSPYRYIKEWEEEHDEYEHVVSSYLKSMGAR